MPDLSARLRRLEQRHAGIRWCRCPYNTERHRAEDMRAMEIGEPTPSVCDVCGGARISIQYVLWDAPPRHSFPGAERERA